jgi:hypothetical protein
VYTEFWYGNLRKKDHMKDQGADTTILQQIFKEWGWGIDGIDLFQDKKK